MTYVLNPGIGIKVKYILTDEVVTLGEKTLVFRLMLTDSSPSIFRFRFRPNFIANLTPDSSQLSFGVNYLSLAQKLWLSEIKFVTSINMLYSIICFLFHI